MKELADLQLKYNIQIGKDRDKPAKMGKELYNISWIK